MFLLKETIFNLIVAGYLQGCPFPCILGAVSDCDAQPTRMGRPHSIWISNTGGGRQLVPDQYITAARLVVSGPQ